MKHSTLKSVYTALFAALLCASSVIAIPIGPIPIVLQNAFAVLAGLLLGPIQGGGAVGLFLLVGGLGLPVFSGGKGGIAVFAGPTGGYLVGYYFAAFVAGISSRKAPLDDPKLAFPIILSATISAFIAIYIPGILVLKRNLGLPMNQAIAKGIIPFLVGDFIKIAILVPVSIKLRPIIARYLTEPKK